MSKILKRIIGVILALCMVVPALTMPAFSAELTDITELDLSSDTLKKIYFKVETDKDFATYEVGEEIVFTATLWADMDEDTNKDNDIRISAPYFKYTLKGDDGKSTTGYSEASSGQVVYKTTLSNPGAVRLVLEPAYASKDVISDKKVTQFNGGAMAAADEICVTTTEPEDFDEFWSEQLAELDAVEPELLYIKEKESAVSGFKVYEVRIACVDDTCPTKTGNTYVSGMVSIPDTAGKGILGLDIRYNGYGVYKSGPEYKNGYIHMNVSAHSLPLDQEDSYYTDLEYSSNGVLKNYGFSKTENADPKTSYFRNMFLRDVQAVRFLKKYFGSTGVQGALDGVSTTAWTGLWDEERLTVRGSSQGGFQSVAVAALDPDISGVYIDVPWFADVAGDTDPKKIPSTYRPTYAAGLDYYDTALLAKRIKAPLVNITAGAGDPLCPMGAVQAIYNNLVNESAKLTFRQGGEHGSTNSYPIDSVQMRSESPVITGKVDSTYTKIEWVYNIGTKVLTISPTADTGWNEIGDNYLAGSWGAVANIVEEVVIVGKLYKISGGAFKNHKNLKKVTITRSATQIASDAFAGCSALTQVCFEGDASLPNTADLSRFRGDGKRGHLAGEENIFSGATSIKAVILNDIYSDEMPIAKSNLPDNLETVYGPHDSEYLRSFCQANGFKFVPYGKNSSSNTAWAYDEGSKTVTVFGEGRVDGIATEDIPYLSEATSLVLNSGISELYGNAFADLTSLENVTILGNAPKTSIGAKPFGEKDETFTVTVSSKATGFKGTAWCGYKLVKLSGTAGDINSDGEINAKDAVLLAQYLAGWSVTVSSGAADTNGDDEVYAKDAVLLAQYLAGWNVELVTRPFEGVDYGDNEFIPGDIW